MCDKFSDADRLGCEGCPGNPENREYMQQRGVGSSYSKPKRNPVLEAIDAAMLKPKGNKWSRQNGREEFCPSYANEALMKVKAVYLQQHPQGPKVAGHTTKYYTCPQCKTPIDMTGTGLDGHVAPGDGEEFERVLSDTVKLMNTVGSIPAVEFSCCTDDNVAIALATYFESIIDAPEIDSDDEVGWSRRAIKYTENLECRIVAAIAEVLTAAHNTDCAADKQRIAELEQLTEALKGFLDQQTQRSDNASVAVRRLKNIAKERVSEAKKRIAELEEQLAAAQKPREMKRWGVDGVPPGMGEYWIMRKGENGPVVKMLLSSEVMSGRDIHTKFTHWLELEPAPTLPEASDGMIAGDGD